MDGIEAQINSEGNRPRATHHTFYCRCLETICMRMRMCAENGTGILLLSIECARIIYDSYTDACSLVHCVQCTLNSYIMSTRPQFRVFSSFSCVVSNWVSEWGRKRKRANEWDTYSYRLLLTFCTCEHFMLSRCQIKWEDTVCCVESTADGEQKEFFVSFYVFLRSFSIDWIQLRCVYVTSLASRPNWTMNVSHIAINLCVFIRPLPLSRKWPSLCLSHIPTWHFSSSRLGVCVRVCDIAWSRWCETEPILFSRWMSKTWYWFSPFRITLWLI